MSSKRPVIHMLIASFAGGVVAASVIGVFMLSKHKSGRSLLPSWQTEKKVIKNKPIRNVQMGLLRLYVPKTMKDVLKNDVLIEEAVKQVAEKLWVYVDVRSMETFSKGHILDYISRLFNDLWDAACYHENTNLDIRIMPANQSQMYPTWSDLLRMKGLNAVFGEDATVDLGKWNAIRMKEMELTPITYHPLTLSIQRRLTPSLNYFEDPETTIKHFKKVILGGTFDHLHNGHKKLLLLASEICAETMVIGITADHMLRNKSHAYLIQDLKQRMIAVREYMYSIRPDLTIQAVTIHDPFGPSITLEDVEAIVVSTETIAGAHKVNDLRKERSLSQLEIYVCRRTEASTLSSSYIRAEEDQKRRFTFF